MQLKKIGNVYHAQFKTATGSIKTLTTRCKDLRQAKQVVKDSGIADMEQAAKAGRLTTAAISHIVSGKKITVAGAMGPYREWLESTGRAPMTIVNNIANMNNFMHDQQVENLPPAAVNEKHINAFINNPDSASKAQTRKVNLASLRSFFGFCSAKGWSVGDPSQLVRVRMDILSHEQKEPKQIGTFNAQEIKQLIGYFQEHGDVFWEFAVRIGNEIGLRLGDICQLEWDCFREDGYAVVWTDKRDRRVKVKISQELAELITEIPISSDQYLFPKHREVHKTPNRRAELSTHFKRVCARLKIMGRSYHCVRHTCITRWAKEGKSLESIGKDVGHSDEKTTQGYIHD